LTSTYDVLVIGAGYIGCAVAHSLSAGGLRTALLDRGGVAAGASRANYGSVQVQDADLTWSLPMTIAGSRRLATLEDKLGCSIGYRRRGSLLVIETESQWETMAARLSVLQEAGIHAELVSASRMSELEPLLDCRSVLGASYHPDEAQVNPFKFIWAYLHRAQALGLELHRETTVVDFDVKGGRLQGVTTSRGRFSAGTVVLTTGAWTPALGRTLGRTWHIPHVHGQALVTEATDLRLHNHLSSAAFFEAMHDAPAGSANAVLAVSQSAEGHFLLGEAGITTDSLGTQATSAGVAAVAAETRRLIPVLDRLRVIRSWAAPVAFTADGLPFLGPVAGLQGLVLATAFKSTVVVTPVVATAVAQLVLDGHSDLILPAFSPDREMAHVA
jgi:sarcosine oxidase, subunit beta